MANTRSSTGAAGSSPQSAKSTSSKSGTKRKADEASPSSKAKRGRPAKAKEQKTLEETMPDVEDETVAKEVEEAEEANGQAEVEETEKVETNGDEKDASHGAEESKEAATNGDEKHGDSQGAKVSEEATENSEKPDAAEDMDVDKITKNGEAADDSKGLTESADESKQSAEKADESTEAAEKAEEPTDSGENALNLVKADAGEAGTTTAEKSDETKDGGDASNATAADAVEEDKEREKAMPSNILEKGIIYFFTRGRVGVEDPDSVQDLARSYFVMRPLPDGAKLTDGAIPDVGNNRLLALPKKVWPKSGTDRFMVFVDKAKVSIDTLRDEFFQGSEYSTKTVGTRQTPEVTPLGEGVYAMTSTGGRQGTTHLAYMLTIPSEIGDVQKDVGIKEKGSFILSVKNPEASAPSNAQPANTAEYPKEIIEEFSGRGWMPAHPKHIDYNNASVLLIGEDFDNSSNLDAAPKEEKDDKKETPQEQLEKLEHEDELRVEHLKGNDTIFVDLGISSKEYPKVLTTW